MRVLTSPADTGAATLALPQDVQTEAFDYPEEFFERRIWHIGRVAPDRPSLDRAAELIRAAKRPLIVAGGGVIYSEAVEVLKRLVRRTGIPVAETQAGKGSLPFDHPGALRADWDREVSRLYNLGHTPLPAQSEVLGAVNDLSAPRDVVVCAAGSMPGDLHKLWRTRDAKGYHVEYGYSTMGYEIAGGLGVRLADPSREVYVMVGDGSYLMMAQEIVTSIQEHAKLTI